MIDLNHIYKGSFFSRRYKLSWRVPYVCDAIAKVFAPMSLIDVGCGIGDYVSGFRSLGIDAKGIEGSTNCLPYLSVDKELIYIEDIRRVVAGVGKGYDLAICFEVLEHIEESFLYNVIFNFHSLSNKLLVSAAGPGQKGHHHVNCREPAYWERMFSSRGYKRDKHIEDEVKDGWKQVKHKKEMSSYYNNLLFFEREVKNGNTKQGCKEESNKKESG